ncbi:sugar phosphate isomerase/epimerase family protein [Candidatus Njordibacter sp. Uisw_039]|uniref:sugar phosphate isomerase/epimerase family protein n=1 Tax=Candidatus Njordibacter sp. Uisw_039 TaxID=3230972 RepID=UPI003D59CF42
MKNRIGYMQGRLSPMVNGLIQSFPWQHWQSEFPLAEKIGLGMMEWTLDQDNLYENPLLTADGQNEIRQLCTRHSINICSLTGDCFMQAPFWKAKLDKLKALEEDFIAIANACSAVGITFIVVPLVDNGRLENPEQENQLVKFLQEQADFFVSKKLKVIFECDFNPIELTRFIDRLDPNIFGINYDIGNSAAIGFLPEEELAAYGHRVLNVHVKDRVFDGNTVPLGFGTADFEAVFKELSRINYQGNFILQTARSVDDDHMIPLARYRDMTDGWIKQFGLTSDV